MTSLTEAKLFINGELRGAASGKTFDVISPWTDAPCNKAADAGPEDVDAAIAAARSAFDKTDWSHDSMRQKRFEIVSKYLDLFKANFDRLADIAVIEGGCARGSVNREQVAMALQGWQDYLDVFPRVEWTKDYGVRETWGFKNTRTAYNEPIGVVGAITPWNAPLYVNVGKVVAALLTGCTVILKPAPDTPSMGAIFGELANEAGIPKGVMNVVFGADPALAGEMLVTDPRVDLISFTGSTGVGRRIMEQGAPTLKRVFLELGGKSARIVLEDDPNFARNVAMGMLVNHAGQGCAVQSRLLVHRSRYEEAKAILKATYEAYTDSWGEQENPAHTMGPVVNRKQYDRVLGLIEVGKQEATLLAGGNARPDKGPGYLIEPTCFVDVTNDMRIAQEEIFGPVVVVIPFDDDEDAIRIANDSPYGLSGGVCTADIERGVAIGRRIHTGTFSVNNGMCIAGDLPFGGCKASGVGREWGVEGIEEYLEPKLIAIAG